MKINKYASKPQAEIDLHGYTMQESKEVLDALLRDRAYKVVRIIVGRGNNSEHGPVLPAFVRNYLTSHRIRFNQSKIQDGGEGALEVFFD